MWKTKFVQQKCLVCKTRFGQRDLNTVFAAHCDDCRATYTWQPGEEKPTAVLDKHKPQRCGCNSCGR